MRGNGPEGRLMSFQPASPAHLPRNEHTGSGRKFGTIEKDGLVLSDN
jgi:hypothetical protein